MSEEQYITLLAKGLANAFDTVAGQLLRSTLDHFGYEYESNGRAIYRIHDDDGDGIYDHHDHNAVDCWENLGHEIREQLRRRFSTNGSKMKTLVVVGKSRFLPFPDRKLTPAATP